MGTLSLWRQERQEGKKGGKKGGMKEGKKERQEKERREERPTMWRNKCQRSWGKFRGPFVLVMFDHVTFIPSFEVTSVATYFLVISPFMLSQVTSVQCWESTFITTIGCSLWCFVILFVINRCVKCDVTYMMVISHMSSYELLCLVFSTNSACTCFSSLYLSRTSW